MRRVVNAWLNAWRAEPHHHGNQPALAAGPAKEEVTSYSARKTRWRLWQPSSDLTSAEAHSVAALTDLCPQTADAQSLFGTFRTIVTERCVEQLDPWLEQGERSGISAVVGVAQGLRRDDGAVTAALRYAWSQGPVEGHLNPLTMIKRQM